MPRPTPRPPPVTITTFQVAGDATVYQADGTGTGDTATISGVGTITIETDGSYSFTPAANYNGSVPQVTYTLTDGSGTDDTSTLDISVTPVNDDFTDADETVAVAEDLDCSGLPVSDEHICTYDEGFLAELSGKAAAAVRAAFR